MDKQLHRRQTVTSISKGKVDLVYGVWTESDIVEFSIGTELVPVELRSEGEGKVREYESEKVLDLAGRTCDSAEVEPDSGVSDAVGKG